MEKLKKKKTITVIIRGLTLDEAVDIHEYASKKTHNIILKESKAGKL